VTRAQRRKIRRALAKMLAAVCLAVEINLPNCFAWRQGKSQNGKRDGTRQEEFLPAWFRLVCRFGRPVVPLPSRWIVKTNLTISTVQPPAKIRRPG
jgi:hypothetical protein